MYRTGESQLPGTLETGEFLGFHKCETQGFPKCRWVTACRFPKYWQVALRFLLWKFQVDSIKIGAWGNYETEEFL